MKKIIIIKLGADGDVIRTLSLLDAIKKQHPESSLIWITKGDIAELLEGNELIDKIYNVPLSNIPECDILYNFDIDKEAASLASSIPASKKYGFYVEDEHLQGYNWGAEYYISTIFDDELKKQNKRTYQRMMFDMAELPYSQKKYELVLKPSDLRYASDYVEKHALKGRKVIGIHLGASARWPSKAWHLERVEEFIKKAEKNSYAVLLFGGPNEAEKHSALIKKMENSGFVVYSNDANNTKRQFAALVSLCDVMICSDSLALHVALGLNKKTVGLFFCTSPDEIEDYGLLIKIKSPLLEQFFPERMDEYNEELVKSISAEEVLHAVESLSA